MYSNLNPSPQQSSTRIIQTMVRGILLAAVILSLAPAPAVQAADQPLTVTITQLEQIGDDFDIASLGDFYARVTINATTLSSYDQQIEDLFGGYTIPTGNILPNPWVLTQVVPGELGTVAVQIDILDDDIVLDSDRADINPDTNKKVVDIVVDLTTGKWSGDVAWPQSCVSGPIDLSSKSVAICFDISVLSSNGDADEDGLLDGWELFGFNADDDTTIDIDLPAFGANPLRKDVFVEVDCLVASSHSHCPRPDAIADVVQSFANAPISNPDGTTGVQLHVDIGPLYGTGISILVVGVGAVSGSYGDLGGGGSWITEAGNEIIQSFYNPQGTAIEFATLREDYFDSRRALIFRYAIFGHQSNSRRATNDCTAGVADGIPGREFLVTLGGVNRIGDPCVTTDANGFSVGNRQEQAGTFMHELGHTLGLSHGGNNETHRKPNYLSVMNYAFPYCLVPASPNGLLPGGCDYSRINLPALNEISLDECLGLDAGLLGFGPNNWDGDGLIEGVTNCLGNNMNTVADTNNDGICVEPGTNETRDSTFAGDDFSDHEKITDGPNRVCETTKGGDDIQKTAVGFTPSQPNSLTGHDDWNSLTYSLMAIAGAGSNGSTPVENEPDPETIRESREYLGNLLAPAVEIVLTGPATAVPDDLLTYTVEISNEGRGPAIHVMLTDTAPDGSSQVSDIGAVTVGSLATRTSDYTVPLNACPGDFSSVMAWVNFEDFVGHQLTASSSAPLEILDIVPPTLTLSVSPTVLWSPDHKFYDVTAAITVTDNCDTDATITLVSVTSNEPATGFLGKGDKGPDIQGAAFGTDDRLFSLRSERGTGGQNTGRVYTITYRATDNSGNTTEATATVKVPTSSSGSH